MRGLKMVLLATTLVVLTACGTNVHLVPELTTAGPTNIMVAGLLQYNGNQDYLPRTVGAGDDGRPFPEISYQYNVGYGKDAVPDILPLFNPLSLVGFPIGSDSVIVVGELVIAKNGNETKKYSSTCVLNKNRSLFYEGDTFSELRRKGLLMVRDNIETQMSNDTKFLSGLQD